VLSILFILIIIRLFFFTHIFNSQIILTWNLAQINRFKIELNLLLDYISISISLTVFLISISVFLFSTYYISIEKFFFRFHLTLLLFVISIIILVLRPNLFALLIGWDGLGVTSYLLVIFYNRNKSYNAGIVTALTNRLGDIFLILAISIIIKESRMLISWYTFFLKNNQIVMFIIIMASFTKRAQIPFSSWLPAAIAAPTPVSSLVHSSTLVTAGIYIMIRHTLFIETYNIINLVLFSGIITMIIARITALNEKDIKKMIALSTLRQLGIIITGIGLSWRVIAFIHIIIHAFFKAIMFISTGNFIHFRTIYQNLLKTGGLVFSSPLNRSRAIVSRIRLAATPFSAAFFSKEPLLEILIWRSNRLTVIILFILGIILTIGYSTRFIYLVLLEVMKLDSCIFVNEADTISNVSILILFLPSFTRGIILSNLSSLNSINYALYSYQFKLLIILILLIGVTSILTLQSSLSFFFNLFQFSIFFIWALPLFSARLFVFFSIKISKNLILIQRLILTELSAFFKLESMLLNYNLFYTERISFFKIITAIPIIIVLILFIRLTWNLVLRTYKIFYI